MKHHRLAVLATPIAALLLAFGLASPAQAATIEQKLAVLSSWSQPNVASYDAWNSARQNQGAWADYGFDWSTDYCSTSPDQPLGFDFRMPCWHHDFGYRNYKLVGQFPANKSRIDDTFYADLKRKCGTYNVFVRPACNSLAWTYYQAVKAFGNVQLSQADLDRATTLKKQGELAAAEAKSAPRAARN
jgi:hypothetical protein